MRRAVLFFLFVFIISPLISQYGELPPLRYAKEVMRVSKPYSGADWIVSPFEEGKGDQKVSNAYECDIRAIAAVNDARRLRIDIYLHNPVTYKWKVYYSFRITYKYGTSDTFIYFPTRKEFYYGRWDRNGNLVKSRLLKNEPQGDTCGVTDSFVSGRRRTNTVVYLIIDKDKHFAKTGRGEKRWLTTRFSSGYIRKGAGDDWIRNIREADTTMRVRLGYIR